MTTAPKRRWAYARVFVAVAMVALSSMVTYLFRTELDNTGETIGLIVSIFSILAGVLITIISILGDPSMLMDQSWRHSYLASQEIQRRLHRKTDVFVLYILLLASSLAFHLTPDCTAFYTAVQAVTLFLTCMSFCASLLLPFDLMKIQKERMRKAVDAQKLGRG